MNRASRLALIGLLLITGCTPTTPTAGPPTSGAPPTSSAQPTLRTAGPAPACPTSDRYSISSAGYEVEGAGNASLWALLFLTSGNSTLPANREAKIVIRMTGSGDLSVRAVGPQGQQLNPQWGPDGHSGSIWQRPGDEWGTGWIFPAAGCWTVQTSRTDGSAAAFTLRAS